MEIKRVLAGVATGAVLTGGIALGSVAPAEAAPAKEWTNCGPYTCTTYFTKAQSRAYADYFSGTLARGGKISDAVLCGALAGIVNPAAGVVAGAWCAVDGGDYNVTAWVDATQGAVASGGCLQVEKPRKGFGLLKPGFTTHPSYCRG